MRRRTGKVHSINSEEEENKQTNMAIDCLVLGAGQEVGKSCIVVTINGKKIMFDCGMHMGYTDHRRYPDFSLISESGDFNSALSCIIITHLYDTLLRYVAQALQKCGWSPRPYWSSSIFY